MVARGPVPPPDSVRSPVLTVGVMLPSGLRFNVASRPVQAPLTSLRTGIRLRVRVSVPFGLAVTVSVTVVAAVASTGWPVAFAWLSAWSTEKDPAAVGTCAGAAGGAAEARIGAVTVAMAMVAVAAESTMARTLASHGRGSRRRSEHIGGPLSHLAYLAPGVASHVEGRRQLTSRR